MPKTRKKRKIRTSSPVSLPVLRPNAAGINIGSREIYVAVPPDRDPYPVRSFPTFTSNLLELANWLKQCGIDTVAMESTGVYWISLFQILEGRGFEVFLVNAHHVKNVPGRKSDVSDCQWLQYLHSVGLLRTSFRPPQNVCQMRAIMRHRDNLVQLAATHVQHMQKALDQMNLQLHHVISDLTGMTGLAILDAILEGQRDPKVLAELRDPRIKASPETIAKSLAGDYQPEHLFVLRQSLASYRAYQKQILECDEEIQTTLTQFESQADPASLPPRSKKAHEPQRNQFHFDLRAELHRVFGVDLTAIPDEFRQLFDVETAMAYMAWYMDRSLFGQRVEDVQRSVDYALSRQETDRAGVWVIGKGMGALWALYAAALDSRIRSVVCQEGLLSYRTLTETDRYLHGANIFILDVLNHFDLPQVAAAVAGRRLTLLSPVNAMKQPVDIAAAREAYSWTNDVYSARHAQTKFRVAALDPDQPLEDQYLWALSSPYIVKAAQ